MYPLGKWGSAPSVAYEESDDAQRGDGGATVGDESSRTRPGGARCIRSGSSSANQPPLGRPLGAGTEGGQCCLRSPPGTSRGSSHQSIGVDQHAVQ